MGDHKDYYNTLTKKELIKELMEYDSLFKLQRSRIIKATEIYLKETNSETNIRPDLGTLISWLLKKAGYEGQ